MKKQFQILAATFITVAFISCSKEKIETNDTSNAGEIATAKKPGGGSGGNAAFFGKNLEALYQFNSDLKEATGKLADAVPTISSEVKYTADRNGVPNNAILFSGRYGLDVLSVPCQSSMSVAAWMKYSTDNSPFIHVVNGGSAGPTLSNENNIYKGLISTPATTGVSSLPMDDKWHHLVATYDANNLRFYVDGKLIGSSFNPVTPWSGGAFTYRVSYYPSINIMWQGSMDDLCYYSRTLTAAEVEKLYNQ
jgi:hypothetical protein